MTKFINEGVQIMDKLIFLKQFFKRPRTVGAILPSSKYLADKMIEGLDFKNAEYIVEFGPGTGIFTRNIVRNRNTNTVIILFENNYKFCKILREKYKNEPNLYIINDSAEYMDNYLSEYNIPYVDYIVSGLPFASLPSKVSSNILSKAQSCLKNNGKFITFQYTLLKKKFIKQYFDEVYISWELRNIPPAYVFYCSR
jgi:phospholipid N-methyltransferase